MFDGLDFSFVERTKQLDVVHRAFALSQYIKVGNFVCCCFVFVDVCFFQGTQSLSVNHIAAEQHFLRGFESKR